MVTSICTSCLSRLRLSHHAATRLSNPSVMSLTASFHAFAPFQNVQKKKSNAAVVNKFRVGAGARIKKKQRERARPPAPGERKAQRKRIVLSNTNAIEVPGLEYLTRENISSSDVSGRMLAIQGPSLDQLRDSRAFKTTQNWSLFRQPSTLVRAETVELGKDIADITASREDQGFGTRTVQKIITGEQGSGKSIYLLQAMNMAFLNDWVVLHIPECQDYTINQSAYTPETTSSEESTEQRYDQSTLATDVLTRLASANATVLSKLKLNHTHDKSIRIQKDASLKDLAQIGAEEPSMAMPIFSALWKELTVEPKDTTHKQPRPSLLVTIDGLDHWMGPTLYRSSDYQPVHAHQFTLIRHFLNLLFSPRPNHLPYGGMILAATTRSNTTNYPSFNLLLDQMSALQNGLQPTDPQFPVPRSYAKIDQRVLDLLKKGSNTDLLELKGVSRPESKSLLEYFARSGVLREKITDTFVGSTFTLTANGIIGELCKFGSRIRV